MLKLSLAEARRLTLRAQGVLPDSEFCQMGAAKVLQHLGYVQLDTISVVERAHHHVFWTRQADYEPTILQKLIHEKEAFEYWSHAASVLPMRDYRFSLPLKNLYLSGKKHWFGETSEHKRWKLRILQQIREEGPKSIRSFPMPRKQTGAGWFERTPAKQALEQLFMEGRLLVTERKGFEKIYDLPERVLPSRVNTSVPSVREEARHLIDSFLRSHAFGRPEEMAYLRSRLRAPVQEECERMLRAGILTECRIEGMQSVQLASVEGLNALMARDSAVGLTARILSPFDNLVIQRKRLQTIFDFDYQIECYVPEAKRKFGYFSLPVLLGTAFAGQIDAKAFRAEQRLCVKGVYPASDFSAEQVLEAAAEELRAFAKFNRCEQIDFPKSKKRTKKGQPWVVLP